MSAASSYGPNVKIFLKKKGSCQTGMPLIMVKGKLRCLNSMTEEELERFIPFMVKCSVERGNVRLVNNVPIWWQSPIDYNVPFKRPEGFSKKSFRYLLASLVRKCYEYHNVHYLIEFCSGFADCPGGLIYQMNKDNTTSLFTSSYQHLLTYSNECAGYDWTRNDPPKSPRRNLMPPKPLLVFICDNCGMSFTSETAINGHERLCYGPVESIPNTTPSSQPVDLLGYLRLGKTPTAPSEKRAINISMQHCRTTEFSSVLGRLILAQGIDKRDIVSKPQKSVQIYDGYCSTTNPTRMFKGFKRQLRSRILPLLQRPESYHIYPFSRQQRKERFLTLATGLNKESRDLLLVCDRLQCYIKLTRCKIPSPPSSREPSPDLVDLCSSSSDHDDDDDEELMFKKNKNNFIL